MLGWPKGKRRGKETVPNSYQQAPPGAACIPLTRGWVAWVDSWCVSRLADQCYLARPSPCGIMVAARSATKEERATGAGQFVIMANESLQPPPGMLVDHVQHDLVIGVIDNRRTDLQLATKQQNNAGKRKGKRVCSSVFKGVTWDRRHQRWLSHIMVDYRTNDLAAVRHFGDHALTNFPVPGSTRSLFGGVA